MVVAARPCSQFWEDSLPTLLNGAPNLRWAYVELLTDLAAFNACAAQIPMWKHDYREFETAMAGHDINTDFGKPDEPLPALTLGEWACLEKVDSDSGRFAGVFGWLFFESHR